MTCRERIGKHFKRVSPDLASLHMPQSTTLGVPVQRSDRNAPEYFYNLTTDGSNSGIYNLSSQAIPFGIDRDSFTTSGVHLDGLRQHMIIPDIALMGSNVSIGFTFSLDSFERVHQTIFQLISECRDAPVNLYIQAKVKSEITGLDTDYFQVSFNDDLTSIEVDKLQKRSPISLALVLEGLSWTFYVDGKKVGTFPAQSVFPPLFGKAKLGSQNSFAGLIQNLFIYDRALSPEEVMALAKSSSTD